MKLAVIGRDVSASLSPDMHAFIARSMGNEITYDALSVPEEEFEGRIEGVLGEYDGLNVTIPYKRSVMSHLKHICGDAAVFGAVNTVRCADLTGHNTDGLGFMLMLRNNNISADGAEVLLLGAGGAGRAVAKKLAEAGAKVYIYDKNTQSALTVAKECRGASALISVEPRPYDIAINATGVGMHRTVGLSPVGKDILTNVGTAVDLIYEPRKSAFLQLSESLGKKTVNGGAMLFYQAYYAECIFFGACPDDGQAAALYKKYQGERQ